MPSPLTPPRFRKLGLTTHVVVSVGWLGAVAAFLVLSIAGRTSQDADVVRSSYLAMNLIGGFLIVPLSIVTLVTGLIQALGTHWGLRQYYWILVKLGLTVVATIALMLHQYTAVNQAAQRASGPLPSTELDQLGTQLVADAGLAVVVLLVITILSVYKPWGRTRYGRRKLGQDQSASTSRRTSPLIT